jgi:hypothetical protein
MATRSVFYGFNAYVGAIIGKHACRWWPDDPETYKFETSFQIEVDLSKTPEAHRQGLIEVDQIKVDDFAGFKLGGRTTIGPDWPLGATVGGCWLESRTWELLPASNKPGRIPPGFQCHDYELTSVLFWDGPLAHRRFQGFRGIIQSRTETHALISIFPGGRSLVPGIAPAGTFWIDHRNFAIVDDCNELGLGAKDRHEGPVFIDVSTIGSTTTVVPMSKHPVGMGSDLLFPKK